MKVLVTSAGSEIGQQVINALVGTYDLVLIDVPAMSNAESGIKPSNLGHGGEIEEVLEDVNAVIHIGFGGQEGDTRYLIDYYTRCTYNLYKACVNAGVKQAFYLSTLRLLEDYEQHLTVTNRWKSLPSTDPDILSAHLGEYVTREFARDSQISMAVLRLGFPIVQGTRSDARATGVSSALATDDLGVALRAALKSRLPNWKILHIQSPLEQARFLMTDTVSAINYPPDVVGEKL